MNIITYAIVNSTRSNGDEYEQEYVMNRPDWEFHKMMAELEKQHPRMTSAVITMVRRKE